VGKIEEARKSVTYGVVGAALAFAAVGAGVSALGGGTEPTSAVTELSPGEASTSPASPSSQGSPAAAPTSSAAPAATSAAVAAPTSASGPAVVEAPVEVPSASTVPVVTEQQQTSAPDAGGDPSIGTIGPDGQYTQAPAPPGVVNAAPPMLPPPPVPRLPGESGYVAPGATPAQDG